MRQYAAKTYSMKSSEIDKNWLLFDAENAVLGRLASQIAKILRGKHKANFTPHMDCGDHVVVINAEKIALSGKKLKDKIYYRHTGYPGGIKSDVAGKILSGPFAERVLRKAVERMMPGGPLSRQQLRHLKIYTGNQHPHEAQQPQKLDFLSQNRKNKRA
ncbi:MAG: 50S ribosomal protein L13 [Pseudomonadota bacterium]